MLHINSPGGVCLHFCTINHLFTHSLHKESPYNLRRCVTMPFLLCVRTCSARELLQLQYESNGLIKNPMTAIVEIALKLETTAAANIWKTSYTYKFYLPASPGRRWLQRRLEYFRILHYFSAFGHYSRSHAATKQGMMEWYSWLCFKTSYLQAIILRSTFEAVHLRLWHYGV